jgi:hypothetical protein
LPVRVSDSFKAFLPSLSISALIKLIMPLSTPLG